MAATVRRDCGREDKEAGEPLVANGDGGSGPGPTIWPIGFAVGIVCILVGLIVSNVVVAAGVIIAAIFGFLWARAATHEYRGTAEPEALEPAAASEPAAVPVSAAPAPEPDMFTPDPGGDEVERYPRSVFLEASTLGLGALIGALVTIPVLGFVVLPSFEDQEYSDVNLGPLDNFPEGKWIITQFFRDPTAGEVSHRVAYIRNNGNLELHDHLQPLRAPRLPGAAERPRRREPAEDDQRHPEQEALRGHPDPGSAVRLRLPLPRRPVRHRGQPDRRPACARARPLRVLDRQPQPRARTSRSVSPRSSGRARTRRSSPIR